ISGKVWAAPLHSDSSRQYSTVCVSVPSARSKSDERSVVKVPSSAQNRVRPQHEQRTCSLTSFRHPPLSVPIRPTPFAPNTTTKISSSSVGLPSRAGWHLLILDRTVVSDHGAP